MREREKPTLSGLDLPVGGIQEKPLFKAPTQELDAEARA
jgi:hypothetical protein